MTRGKRQQFNVCIQCFGRGHVCENYKKVGRDTSLMRVYRFWRQVTSVKAIESGEETGCSLMYVYRVWRQVTYVEDIESGEETVSLE